MLRAFDDRRIRLLPIAIIAASTLAACGGGDSGSSSSTPSSALMPDTANPGNTAPTITGAPAGTVGVGETYSFKPVANDRDGDALTFSVSGLPAWASFDPASGQITGTPPNVGTFANITVSVSDGQATVSLKPFTIAVTGAASTPGVAPSTDSVTLAWDAPTTNSDGTPLTDLTGYTIHYGTASQNYSKQIVIANPSITRYVVEGLPPGQYYFAVAAYNSKGIESPPSSELSQRFN